MRHLWREVVEVLELLKVLGAGVVADSEFDSESKRDWSKLLPMDDAGVKGTQLPVWLRNALISSRRSFRAHPSKVMRVEVAALLSSDSMSAAGNPARVWDTNSRYEMLSCAERFLEEAMNTYPLCSARQR